MKIIVYGQFVRAALIGLMQKIKALWCPLPKRNFVQGSTRGELWRPANLEEVSLRASQSAAEFCKMFQS
ncbi:MAG TPA: hypothetical protein P5262_05015 [Candidatus Moranbacteria bacterium]|nr:hypothetical protein [Candidatus Moranbacteria bacterium]HRZ33915.1 hypothetical protein [Candidatus Moranbacteria bacterium]HRZ95894.1 hypothetical protein [Candidatus Moranbacteria bacterium]